MSNVSTVDVVSTLKGIVEECEVGKWTCDLGLVLDPRDFSHSFADYKGACADWANEWNRGKLLFRVDHHFGLSTILDELRAVALKNMAVEVLAGYSEYTTWAGKTVALPSIAELDMMPASRDDFPSDYQYEEYRQAWREAVRDRIEYRFRDVDTLELV